MVNNVVVMGRLTRDPELKQTASNVPMATFRIACERDYKSRDGKRETDFIDIIAWRQTAEFVSRFFTKGRLVVVTGKMQSRNWEDKDGNKRTNLEVVAESVYFADSKRDEEKQTRPPEFVPIDEDDDLPFD